MNPWRLPTALAALAATYAVAACAVAARLA